VTPVGPTVEMPMFPLGVAHLPGDDVILRVFEPRYVSMFRGLLSGAEIGDPMIFGTALILRGSEVGGGDQRSGRAVTVRVTDVAVAAEGGYAVAGRAESAIEVVEWLNDDPYPRARVRPVPVEVLGESEQTRCLERLARDAQMTRLMLVDAARAGHVDLLLSAEHRARLGLLASGRIDRVDPDDACWLVARSLPCGPTDRLAMLAAESLWDRIDVLERVAEHVREVLAFRLSGS
jgi:Lon protease-like protein